MRTVRFLCDMCYTDGKKVGAKFTYATPDGSFDCCQRCKVNVIEAGFIVFERDSAEICG